MNEFEEFLMFAARFIFILSQKVYNITLDILDWILYGIHLILWFIRRICLRISVSSFVRTIDDCIFFFKCFKEGCHSCRAMRDCLPPRYLRRCRRRIRKMFFCGLFTRDPRRRFSISLYLHEMPLRMYYYYSLRDRSPSPPAPAS